ncbi:WXG100 family type VII secretion target [Streptomyces rimosus]|uniref:WXG100 family type VII secretion target n=1 Tax=Streptomyces rimosus TaxID=1927 RepID=UPI0004CC7700|nr:WXG100 family type VII secretion target [Streptomyces rimosus]
MSGQEQEQQPKIEKSFDLFNPGGDPSVLRACAEAWRHMAHDLKSTVEAQDHEVTRLGDNWTGAAADAFHAHWEHTRSQVDKALPQFETVAHQLDTTADAIQKANDEVRRVVEEIAATVAIGIGLTVLTAGFSDAIAAGAASAEIAEATAEVTRLGQLLIRAAKAIETVKKAMADSKLLKFTVEFGKNTGANFIGNVGGQALTGQKITWGQDFQDAAVAGVVGAGVAEGAGRLGNKVDKWSGSTGKHAAGEAWAPGKTIAAGLEGKNLLGRMAVEGVGSAGGQAAADGAEIIIKGEDKDILRDAAFSGAAGAAGGGANHAGTKINDGGGEHRATGREGLPGWQQVPADGLIYGAGNAANTELGSSD